MLVASCIKEENLTTGNLSLSLDIVKGFFDNYVSGLVLLSYDRKTVIEVYSYQELAKVMGNLTPVFTKDGGKVFYWLGKRK